MLKRLKIHRFRHVAPGTELEFSDRYNVLLGKNGTGKTTLLDLISMVLRSDFSSLRGEEFDIEFELEHNIGGQSAAKIRFAHDLKPDRRGKREGRGSTRAYHPRVAMTLSAIIVGKDLHFDVEVEGAAMRWRVSGGAWGSETPIDVFGEGFLFSACESLIMSTEDPATIGAAFLVRDLALFESAYRFDESLDIFECMTEHASNKKRKLRGAPPISVAWRFFLLQTRSPTEVRPGLSFLSAMSRIFQTMANQARSL